ncbi:MAG TPA: cellulase family glycosylhydrolase [Chloroflexota bacterium]|nr:cellulase family glycosylhydrolase [Chloroflexota bacterium]
MRCRLPLLLLCLLLFACRQPDAATPVAPNEQWQSDMVTTSPPATPPPPHPLTSSPPHLLTPTPAPSPSPAHPFTPSPAPSPTPSFPAYTGPPLRRHLIGIQVHLMDRDQDEIFSHLAALGVGWVKVQVSWKLYEPEPGQLHQGRFAELDAFVNRANALGLQVLLGVSKAPEWSRPTTEMDGPPSDFALYERFMHTLAARYQGRVAAYELWNEPNLQREWNGFPLGGAAFVELLQAGAAGASAADPDAMLIAGAPAVTGINDRVTAVDDRLFLQEMLQAGVADLVDAIGIHPYGYGNPPDSTAVQPSLLTHSHNNHPSFFFADTLSDYRRLLAESGADLPLWVTEFGWGSFENVAMAPPDEATFMADVNEWQQAVYTLRAFEMGQTGARIGPMILWNLNFGPLLGTEFPESGYSLLRPDGTKRPLYFSLAAAPKG